MYEDPFFACLSFWPEDLFLVPKHKNFSQLSQKNLKFFFSPKHKKFVTRSKLWGGGLSTEMPGHVFTAELQSFKICFSFHYVYSISHCCKIEWERTVAWILYSHWICWCVSIHPGLIFFGLRCKKSVHLVSRNALWKRPNAWKAMLYLLNCDYGAFRTPYDFNYGAKNLMS